MTRQSIKQALLPEASEEAPPAHASRRSRARPVLDSDDIVFDSPVPDWCNLGLTLRIVVAVNLLFLCVAAMRAVTLQQWLEQWLGLAMLVEPVLIASLFFGCLVRRLTAS